MPRIEDKYSRNPDLLIAEIEKANVEWVVIDEVQKVPKLLNVAHLLIESKKQKFVLSGSSARKLKSGAANLLAGRAFVYQLFPFTSIELGNNFNLNFALEWGLLPNIY